MVHPKLREVHEGDPLADSLTPVYPTVNGLSQPVLRRLIHAELKAQPIPETLPDEVRRRLGLMPLADAVHLLHRPGPGVFCYTAHRRQLAGLAAAQV